MNEFGKPPGAAAREDLPQQKITGQGPPPVPHVAIDQELVPQFFNGGTVGPTVSFEIDARSEHMILSYDKTVLGPDLLIFSWFLSTGISGTLNPSDVVTFDGLRLKGWVQQPGRTTVRLFLRARSALAGNITYRLWTW